MFLFRRADAAYSPHGRAVARHLIEIHDHLRSELSQIRDLIGQVKDAASAARVRSAINHTTLRQNSWTLGAYCASYCRIVTGHRGDITLRSQPGATTFTVTLPPAATV